MPRYKFQMRFTDRIVEDDDGAEFSDLHAASSDAANVILEVVAEQLRSERNVDLVGITVITEIGTVAAHIETADVLAGAIHLLVARIGSPY
ncbi:hypothetical protein IFT66_22355 [Rhizobium sp. CFBP 13726]|uniref:DUF6894 family protein n=1 Tax=Rhizobium sp. CFBP 13726 TaxID=2775296 RepID=UPI00177B7DCF|nr:hypothetical protein [Rhizobium sp. CFBP 13726]MBD8653838.1 hypothetical protein [Rhizobium sp. CFBP 13726]